MVVAAISYHFERAMLIAASEAGTAMILEREWDMSSRSVGFRISLCYFGVVPASPSSPSTLLYPHDAFPRFHKCERFAFDRACAVTEHSVASIWHVLV